jgi:hypothetical protein
MLGSGGLKRPRPRLCCSAIRDEDICCIRSYIRISQILIIIPTNAQLVLLYTVRLHVSTFIGHHSSTMEYQRL